MSAEEAAGEIAFHFYFNLPKLWTRLFLVLMTREFSVGGYSALTYEARVLTLITVQDTGN